VEIRNHERVHADDRTLCKLAISELEDIYSDLGLSIEELDLLDMPRRSFTVHFPVRMDSGKVKMFVGHRVQYNDARGPAKGGIRFHPELTLDHVKDLAFLMALKGCAEICDFLQSPPEIELCVSAVNKITHRKGAKNAKRS
jgi:hypothetical protein